MAIDAKLHTILLKNIDIENPEEIVPSTVHSTITGERVWWTIKLIHSMF